MSSLWQLSHPINCIVQELSLEECKRMSYLCGGSNSVNVRDFLTSLLVQMQQDQIFLVELLIRMRRYDLLKRVLRISKKEAEVLLENKHVLSDYRVLMTELSEEIGTEDLESLKFMLIGTLPKEKIQKFECFLDVVVELEKLDQISSSKMEIMENYMRAIRRIDLVKRLSQYHNKTRGETQMQRLRENKKEFGPCKNTPLLLPQLRPTLTGFSAASCNSVRPLSTPCVSSAATWSPLSEFPSASCNISRPCVSSAVNQSNSCSTYQQNEEEVYQMKSEPRGVCLIIDCVGTDGFKLKETFLNLHFSVILHLLLSVDDILSTLKQISKQADHFKGDAFICCIISRSRSSRLLGTDLDGPGVDLDGVRHFFTPNSCPRLAGKPKLFFIQGYEVSQPCQLRSVRHFEEGELEMDSPVPRFCRAVEVAEDADVFWSHCWTNEKQLEKSSHYSIYLHALRNALVEGQRGRIHLVDVHMAVNRTVYTYNGSNSGSEYHINLRHTLRKNVYLA